MPAPSRRERCLICGKLHHGFCRVLLDSAMGAPCERAPENGAYHGRARVRVLAPGVLGDENDQGRLFGRSRTGVAREAAR